MMLGRKGGGGHDANSLCPGFANVIDARRSIRSRGSAIGRRWFLSGGRLRTAWRVIAFMNPGSFWRPSGKSPPTLTAATPLPAHRFSPRRSRFLFRAEEFSNVGGRRGLLFISVGLLRRSSFRRADVAVRRLDLGRVGDRSPWFGGLWLVATEPSYAPAWASTRW